MRICAYWDCSREINEQDSFCHEHGPKLNKGLIDQCPKCGRFKDTRYKLCPDCRYGRPIAEWKIRNRNLKAAKYTELELSEKSENVYAESEGADKRDKRGAIEYSRGEAECPRCGSSDLTYKSVFDYFRCNNCKSTFITPVYSYDKEKEKDKAGIESTKDLARQIFGGAQPERQEEKDLTRQISVEAQPMIHEEKDWTRQISVEAQPVRLEEREERVSSIHVGERRKPSNTGWLILFLVFCLVAIIAVAVWLAYGNQVEDLLGGLLYKIAFI